MPKAVLLGVALSSYQQGVVDGCRGASSALLVRTHRERERIDIFQPHLRLDR